MFKNVYHAVKERKSQQSGRSEQAHQFLHINGDHIHSVFDSIPEGMELGDAKSMKDGREFVLCKNAGAASIAPGETVSLSATIYDIDATNEIIIATRDRELIEFYLGASGTTTTKAAMLGSMICVVSSNGIGISRRIIGFEESTEKISGVNRTVYSIRVDIPLQVDLAATSVLKVLVNNLNVTRYDASAENAGFVLLGGSASDNAVAQNKYFFVLKNGLGATKIQTVAATAGSAVKGAVTAGDDGSLQKVTAIDTVAPSGVTPVVIADNSTGFVYRIPPLLSM